MIRCPNCNHEEFPGALFCSECGASLEVKVNVPARTGAESTSTGPVSINGHHTPPLVEEQPTMPMPDRPGREETAVTLQLVVAGKTIPLKGANEFTLGRVSQGQPLIPEVDLGPFDAYDLGVSRLHAVIGIQDLKILITDLGSANGTRVNGVRITPHTPHPLENGDLLALGKLKMQAFIRTRG